MSTIKDMLTSKKGIVGVVKDAKESIKKNRALQSRVSQQYPSDTLGQHFKRVGKVKRIQEWGGIMSGEVPTSKKPEVKRKREKLLPKRVGYKS
jgi:hypothetical protein